MPVRTKIEATRLSGPRHPGLYSTLHIDCLKSMSDILLFTLLTPFAHLQTIATVYYILHENKH